MNYYSNCLLKKYKTTSALKAQLSKNLKSSNEELNDVKECIKKGWNTYLGDNIFTRKRSLINWIDELEKEIEFYNIMTK